MTIHSDNTQPVRAIIRETECIGCVKCIMACPVDAIVGAAQMMHTVIQSECTGCGLCVPACPVDCIELVPVNEMHDVAHAQTRLEAREKRLKKQKNSAEDQYAAITFSHSEDPKAARTRIIQEALLREQKK